MFEAAIGTPGQQKNVVKDATAKIEKSITVIEGVLATCDNHLYGEFWTSTDMKNEYDLSRRVIYSVGQHTALKAFVYADEAHSIPIIGASVSIESIGRTEFTNVEGIGEIVQFKGGDYLLKVKANGFVESKLPMQVKVGKHIEMVIVLEPTLLDVVATKAGKPAAGYTVKILNTIIENVTNAEGFVELEKAPNTGTVEVSFMNGDCVQMEYDMGGLKKLVLNVVVE